MFRMIIVAALAIGSAFGEASVPKGATEIEPGVFKHTDSVGRTFIYKKTPFGFVKSPEKAVKASDADQPTTKAAPTPSPFGDVKKEGKTQQTAQRIKVKERGDMLEFERPSPFGSYRWKRNKNDLTAEERDAWTKANGDQAPVTTPGSKE